MSLQARPAPPTQCSPSRLLLGPRSQGALPWALPFPKLPLPVLSLAPGAPPGQPCWLQPSSLQKVPWEAVPFTPPSLWGLSRWGVGVWDLGAKLCWQGRETVGKGELEESLPIPTGGQDRSLGFQRLEGVRADGLSSHESRPNHSGVGKDIIDTFPTEIT